MLTHFFKTLKAAKELPKRDFLKRIWRTKLSAISELIPSFKFWKFTKGDDDVWLVH
jgi:hypothetical protein